MLSKIETDTYGEAFVRGILRGCRGERIEIEDVEMIEAMLMEEVSGRECLTEPDNFESWASATVHIVLNSLYVSEDCDYV